MCIPRLTRGHRTERARLLNEASAAHGTLTFLQVYRPPPPAPLRTCRRRTRHSTSPDAIAPDLQRGIYLRTWPPKSSSSRPMRRTSGGMMLLLPLPLSAPLPSSTPPPPPQFQLPRSPPPLTAASRPPTPATPPLHGTAVTNCRGSGKAAPQARLSLAAWSCAACVVF